MATTTRWGVLGTGNIASAFVRDLEHAPGAVAAGVGSRTLEGAERFAAEHGIAKSHGTYEELAADPDVDVVYVATPQTRHAADMKLAIAAGKAVLCEKPFTMSAEEARDVVAAARENGVVLVEAMWTRFLPHMRRIKELVSDGAIGEIMSVIADHGQYRPDDGRYDRLLRPELGGGALLDLGVYPVSFAVDLLGRPDNIVALGSMMPAGIDAQTSAVLQYASGAHAVVTTTLRARTAVRAVICGTRGRIEIGPWWFTPAPFTLHRDDSDPELFEAPVTGNGLWYQAAAVGDLLGGGALESSLMPHGDSIAALEVMDEIRRQIGLTYPGEMAPGRLYAQRSVREDEARGRGRLDGFPDR